MMLMIDGHFFPYHISKWTKDIILYFHLDKTVAFQNLNNQLPFRKNVIRCFSVLNDKDSVKFKETVLSKQI